MRTLRAIQPADFDYGMLLCKLVGWNQTPDDWRRLAELTPGGVMVCEEDGLLAGTAATICFDRRVAWIGMILVHPDFRGRGIATSLMQASMDYLRDRGMETVKLDATDAGRPVYLKLGFVDERPICRYVADRATVEQALSMGCECPIPSQVRPIAETDWPAIAAMDAPAFGADRMSLLRSLHTGGPSCVVVRGGEIIGYGFARPGELAGYLGPIVSRDVLAVQDLVTNLLGQLPGEKFFWDIMPDNRYAAATAESFGFTVARNLTRMYRGEKMHPGMVDNIFAIAGFELG